MTATAVQSSYAPGYNSEWHRHNEPQLIYPSRGIMRLQTRAGLWIVPPLRAYWLPASEVHRIGSPGSLRMHSVYCKGALLRRLPRGPGMVPVSGLLRELVMALAEVEADSDAASRMAHVIADQIHLHPTPPLPAPPSLTNRLAPIGQALALDPADSRTLQAWAAELGTTTRTLARMFERQMHMTFSTYRQQVRLHAAVDRLAQGQTATRVAYDLGFTSPSNFTAMFRNATGTTPRAYFG